MGEELQWSAPVVGAGPRHSDWTAAPFELGLNLLDQLAGSAYQSPRTFAADLASTLRTTFDLTACTVWLNAPEVQGLKLKAADGFEYERYSHFMIGPNTYIYRATHSNVRYMACQAPFDEEMFRDPSLLKGKRVKGAVFVPFGHTQNDGLSPLGGIALYSRTGDREHLSQLGEILSTLSNPIARFYTAALQQSLIHLRQQVVAACAFKRDPGSLAHDFIMTLLQEVSCEAGSLWLWDARSKVLRLYATTGLAGEFASARTREITRPPHGNDIVSRVFSTGKLETISTTTSQEFVPIERLPSGLANGVIIPIRVPTGEVRLAGERIHQVGVLVLLNRTTTLGRSALITDFVWEDQTFIDFACEMLSVLTYQQLRTRDFEADFERRMHGAYVNLQSIRDHLSFLEDRVGLSSLRPEFGRYVSNAREWAEDLIFQFNRDEYLNDPLNIQSVGLYGQVLAPIFRLAQRRAQALDLDRDGFLLKGIDTLADSYREIPKVRGNATALLMVMRNLVDNALKYQSDERRGWLELSVRILPDVVEVHVRDNGIGVHQDEADNLFEDGFRGAAARALEPQGLGLGLNDCKRLMHQMRGAIQLVPEPLGAHFVVSIPRMSNYHPQQMESDAE